MNSLTKNIKNQVTRNEQAFLNYHKKMTDIPEPFLLKKFRKEAWTKMEKILWSDLDREDWRYTKYDVFFSKTFALNGASQIVISGLSDKDITSGVRAVKYSDQMSDVMPWFEDRELTGFFYDKWTLLNTSLFNQGVFVEIPKNYKTDETLTITHDYTENGFEVPFTFIKLNEGSELNLIEEYVGEVSSIKDVISNTIIELADDSKINHVFIQNLSRESRGLFYQNVVLGRNAEFQTHSVHLGSKTGRVIQNIDFRAPGGYLKNFGLLYGRDRQHLDIQITQDHKAPHTGGETLYRHVLADRSKSIFKGKIIIEKDKTFCNATQKNENLLLSPGAEAISLPKLEIFNDEVQCSHGSTISSLDEDQLFYLTARGISMDNARKMIIEGFFDEIIKKAATQDIADFISKKIKESL